MLVLVSAAELLLFLPSFLLFLTTDLTKMNKRLSNFTPVLLISELSIFSLIFNTTFDIMSCITPSSLSISSVSSENVFLNSSINFWASFSIINSLRDSSISLPSVWSVSSDSSIVSSCLFFLPFHVVCLGLLQSWTFLSVFFNRRLAVKWFYLIF